MNNFPLVIKHVFTEHLCQLIIEAYETSPHKTKYNKPGMRFTQVDLSIPNARFPQVTVHERFKDVIQRQKFVFFPGKYCYESYRIKRYETDGMFVEHTDVMNKSSSDRFLAAFVYLNNSGGTQFGDTFIQAQAGTMVLFPPMWMYPHSAVMGDTPRYLLSTYLRYC